MHPPPPKPSISSSLQRGSVGPLPAYLVEGDATNRHLLRVHIRDPHPNRVEWGIDRVVDGARDGGHECLFRLARASSGERHVDVWHRPFLPRQVSTSGHGTQPTLRAPWRQEGESVIG